MQKTEAPGSAERKDDSGRKHKARTNENIDAIEELILSQEGAPRTRRTVRHLSTKNDIIIIVITLL